MNDSPFVSIIIPCRNEEQFIGPCLEAILANDYPRDKLEVLVIDGMSEDETRDVVNRYRAEYRSISLHENPRKAIPHALNLGLANAKGDVIMRMDAHAVCPSNYISECVRHLREDGVDSVGGRLVTVPRIPSALGKAIAKALSVPFGVGNSSFRVAPSAGAGQPRLVDTAVFGCWRRDLFDRIGGWNEKLDRSEDVEFNRRLARQGGKILMVPSIVCQYYARSDLRSLARHAFVNGRWAVLPFKYARGVPVAARHLVPLALVSALVTIGLLAGVSKLFLPLFAGVAGAYALANLAASALIALRERDARYLATMPVVFGVLHISYGLGSLMGVAEVVGAKVAVREPGGTDVEPLGAPSGLPARRSRPDGPLPLVSIVIPCRNEQSFIRGCLDSILANDYPKDRLEVLIVDGMSEDGTRDVLDEYRRRHPHVKVLDNPRREQPIALNIAITHASGDVIMRMDGHSTYGSGYISGCVKALHDYPADNVGGRWITVSRDETLLGRAICFATSVSFGVGNAYYRLMSLGGHGPVLREPKWDINVAYFCCRKEIFDTIGLFNERLDRSEDIDFQSRLRRAGYRTLFVPSVECHYLMRTRYVEFVKHMFRNGLWVLLPLSYAPNVSFSMRHIVPLGFVLALAAGTALAFVSALGLRFLGLVLGSYALLSIYVSLRIAARERDPRYFFVLPFIFLSLHVSYGVGSLVGLVRLLRNRLRC